MNWQTEGFPTQPGRYVVDRGQGQRFIVLQWSSQSRDWRDGAVLVRVRRFFGPLPL